MCNDGVSHFLYTENEASRENKSQVKTMNGCKVLIVDDRTQTREGLKALLATAPPVHVVGEAADGEEVISLVEKYRPDVVLMDVSMPVMDGLEATRFIKAQWPEIRVIVLTITAALRAEALAAGADAFLVKGCPIGELLTAILER
jgi:DNA-binding NarL/FixJ family response regulator